MLLMLCSCDDGAGGLGQPGTGVRRVLAFAYPQSAATIEGYTITALAPLQVGVNFGISKIAGDPGSTAELVLKAEVDWGDGSGFEDVTNDTHTKWYRGGEGSLPNDPNFLSLHTYAGTGDHTIIARVTYWDGEVVLDKPQDRVHVVITP
jgi:hypothetical protein